MGTLTDQERLVQIQEKVLVALARNHAVDTTVKDTAFLLQVIRTAHDTIDRLHNDMLDGCEKEVALERRINELKQQLETQSDSEVKSSELLRPQESLGFRAEHQQADWTE
jgi:hypothetical protein